MNLLTSNFNLLHNNSAWENLSKNNFIIDSEFNNFFLMLNNIAAVKKFETVHTLLDLNNKNKIEIIKKINELKKNVNLKDIFLYIFVDNNLKKKIETIKKIELKNNSKLSLQFFFNNQKIKKNNRNNKFISFPYDISVIDEFSAIILNTLKIFKSKPYKLIILDCDNTLWGGILDEDNKKIIYSNKSKGKIFNDFQIYLKLLKDKGYLLSICSKNDEKNVWNLMRFKKMVLQKKDFLSPRINWEEKSSNIKKILTNLSLREEDTLFIDDNFIELQKVKNEITKINCLHFDQKSIFSNLNKDERLNKIRILEEDRLKYKQYKLKYKYDELKKKSRLNLNTNDFLKTLKQKIEFINCDSSNFERAIQLINKTNQFNFSLNRYNANDLRKILNDKNYYLKLVNFKDKFGNHGIIGLFVLKFDGKNILITDLLLSCRILYRKIEDYIIFNILKKFKNKKITIEYKKTTLNNKLIPIFLKNNFFKILKKKTKQNYLISLTKNLHESKKIFNC